MRLAERVLSVVVRDADHRDAIVGDLREEHARQARRIGVDGATRWHLRQSLNIALRYGAGRLFRREPPATRIRSAGVSSWRSMVHG